MIRSLPLSINLPHDLTWSGDVRYILMALIQIRVGNSVNFFFHLSQLLIWLHFTWDLLHNETMVTSNLTAELIRVYPCANAVSIAISFFSRLIFSQVQRTLSMILISIRGHEIFVPFTLRELLSLRVIVFCKLHTLLLVLGYQLEIV